MTSVQTLTTDETTHEKVTETLQFAEDAVARFLYGQRDEHLRWIERALDLEIGARGAEVNLRGSPPDVKLGVELLRQLYDLADRGHDLSSADVRRALDMLIRGTDFDLIEIFSDQVFVTGGSKAITPKTAAQKHYIDAIRRHDLVFGIGPAGTGKTYLAVAMALAALQDKKVKRLVLTRPAVEAGERLGFLPGDLTEKVHPYLRPLLDAIHDLLDPDRAAKMLERGTIEIAPLAFMRGRTLNDSFIILDEAQNTTREQMKMFLTRMGFHSRAVVTGDITQIDLARRSDSGLIEAQRILQDVEGIAIEQFTDVDVVRHGLVQRIIRAYDRDLTTSD